MFKSFLQEFNRIYKLPKLINNSVISVDRYYEELLAEIIGIKLGRGVCIAPLEEEFEPQFRTISVGDVLNIEALMKIGYSNVERVWNHGEISVLGDTVIIWPYSSNDLIRITLLGTTVESIDVLDPQSRKKRESIYSVRIFNSEEDIVFANENAKDILVLRNTPNIFLEKESIDMGIRGIPNMYLYSGSKASINILRDYRLKGYMVWYLTKDFFKYDSSHLLSKYIDEVYEVSNIIEGSIKSGFVYEKGKLVVLTDRELLGEIKLVTENKDKGIDSASLELLKKIVPGDYVVHEDHGIGKFLGLKEENGKQYIEVGYAGNDRLYVPLRASQKLMKYIGSGKVQPKLTGLNSGVWKRISAKAKEDVENIAKELLQIQALREISQGYTVISNEQQLDEYWKFSNEFEYADTEDQYIATKKISEDLQKGKPMDRLLVGDVGFGKTEIAMRAAFAVVNDGYQVAILAPTTVLANQHERVFKERFKNYPFNTASISRLQSNKDREEIINNLKKGKIDIVIGTHSLLSKDIKFKNLGLIIIDEEQKFGVKQKETLKSSRVDTHVFSMTATPIPRTLNMALMGVRDISVLAIAPSGRKEIVNEFSNFNFSKVKDCIVRELKRGGQVYYLHNRIDNIYFVEEKIKEMIPNIRIEVAHGRLRGDRLLGVMERFLNGEIDVLLCTTIIENGLDISNANTLIVDDVNRLGLSQMYQIRGRVGRGERQAYACFFYESLKGDASLRLEAIRESQALGSGFILSNRDLEIRGAGDILGKKQSGTINSIGYGLYTQLLKETIDRMNGNSKVKEIM
jgi:transcription-repair coupling factor (superfamily II helicase)